MIYVENNSNDCFFNHALEEYLMENFDDEIFILWINEPAILIGRNQNTLSEINKDYVDEAGIKVVRRLSGGGTVYNDLGNMNFTFISHKNKKEASGKNTFEKFALPVVEALKKLGLNAEFSGRNDILIEGGKISGNAQYSNKTKLLHHGTILFDCNMDNLVKALKSKPLKFKDKSVKSVGSRVTTIRSHLKEDMTLEDFRTYLRDEIMATYGIESIYKLSEEDIEAANKIREERFIQWQWNYGSSPGYLYENAVKYPCGLVEYNLNVDGGKIKNIAIYGDYFGEKDISELEEALVGVNHSEDAIRASLDGLDLNDYIRGLTIDEFIKALLDIY